MRYVVKKNYLFMLKETMSYNKQLTNLTCSGLYWGILALRDWQISFAL